MAKKLNDEFLFIGWNKFDKEFGKQKSEKAYKVLVDWARKARGQNPKAFDALSEWVLEDFQWTDERFVANEEKLRDTLFCFKEQNIRLRACLKELEPTGIVNRAVFKALDRFDDELSGNTHDGRLREVVASALAEFSVMKDRAVREKIAGHSAGSMHASEQGYINYLKDCDAQIQWCLFMPYTVERQQKGFKVESFEYKTMPAMRFIGKEGDESTASIEDRRELFRALDAMGEYKSGWDYDVLLMHHYGQGVDVEPWHGFWGRFMQVGAPVPEGFMHWDFVPEDSSTPYLTFRSQFAFATFSGDNDAMHQRKGYDSDAMYDVTRNMILGQGVHIPYPDKYWTAEVFLDGHDKNGTAYMFSVEL